MSNLLNPKGGGKQIAQRVSGPRDLLVMWRFVRRRAPLNPFDRRNAYTLKQRSHIERRICVL